MAEIKFNDEQLKDLIASVGKELNDMVKAETAQLAKGAKEDAPAEESEGSEGPASPPPAEEAASADGPPAEGSAPPAEGSAPPAEASAPASPEASAAAAAPEGSPQHEGGEIEPAPTVEALQAEYSKLDPEALKMHFLACKQALMAVMGAEEGAGAGAPPPEASAPPAGAPPPPAPPAGGAPMAMGEKSGKKVVLGDEAGNGGKIEAGKLGKAEAEVADLKKQVADQNEALGKLAKAVEVALTPVRKSVKGVSDLRFVARTEEPKTSPVAALSKKEITAKLREKARDSKLSKADKDLISSYAVGGVDVSKIEHLLKDVA